MSEIPIEQRRKIALRNARGTRRAHKLKSIQWNVYSYGALISAATATVLVLATSAKWAQAIPAVIATIFTGMLRARPELRVACHGHHAAARDLKHEIVRFETQGSDYEVKAFVDAVQAIDKRGSVPLELLSDGEQASSDRS